MIDSPCLWKSLSGLQKGLKVVSLTDVSDFLCSRVVDGVGLARSSSLLFGAFAVDILRVQVYIVMS